jgi:hypothetical protein
MDRRLPDGVWLSGGVAALFETGGAMAAQLRDRRAHQRFQVVGVMPASLMTIEGLTVLNLGTSGALVESAVPLPADGEYRMQLLLPGHVAAVTAKVRRVAPAPRPAGAPRYHIGLEFLSLSTEAEDVIGGFIAAFEGQA